jgi:hypothetical protein
VEAVSSIREDGKMIMNGGEITTSKERLEVCLKVLSRYSLERLR